MTRAEQPDGSWLVDQIGLQVDSDGSPRSYSPRDSGLPALDYLANAGHPGNWYGIACDPHGTPYIQGVNAPVARPDSEGYYVSTTSYQRREFPVNDCRRYLDAEAVPYIVVPLNFRRAVKGIVIGCRAVVTYKGGDPVEAVSGDVGQAWGEGSIKLCQLLGIPGNPKSGGVQSGVTIHVFPGQAALIGGEQFQLQAA